MHAVTETKRKYISNPSAEQPRQDSGWQVLKGEPTPEPNRSPFCRVIEGVSLLVRREGKQTIQMNVLIRLFTQEKTKHGIPVLALP